MFWIFVGVIAVDGATGEIIGVSEGTVEIVKIVEMVYRWIILISLCFIFIFTTNFGIAGASSWDEHELYVSLSLCFIW